MILAILIFASIGYFIAGITGAIYAFWGLLGLCLLIAAINQ